MNEATRQGLLLYRVYAIFILRIRYQCIFRVWQEGPIQGEERLFCLYVECMLSVYILHRQRKALASGVFSVGKKCEWSVGTPHADNKVLLSCVASIVFDASSFSRRSPLYVLCILGLWDLLWLYGHCYKVVFLLVDRDEAVLVSCEIVLVWMDTPPFFFPPGA